MFKGFYFYHIKSTDTLHYSIVDDEGWRSGPIPDNKDRGQAAFRLIGVYAIRDKPILPNLLAMYRYLGYSRGEIISDLVIASYLSRYWKDDKYLKCFMNMLDLYYPVG